MANSNDQLAVIQAQQTIDELKKIGDSTKQLIATFKELVKQADKVNQSLDSGRPRDYADAISHLRDVTSQYTAIEQQLADALARVARLETQQARTATEQARTRAELARSLREESQLRQQLAREQRDEARNNANESSAYRRLVRDRNEARLRARDYGAEMLELNRAYRNGTINQQDYRRQLAQLSTNFRDSSREAIRLDREVRRLNQATTPSANRNGALWGRVTDIAKAAGIITLVDNIASSFYKLGNAYYETTKTLDTLRAAQTAVFKTSEEVGRQNMFLTTIANKYGIELIGLSQAYTQFSASAQGTTLEGQKSMDIFDAVSKSSAMLGVSADDTAGVLKALGQMLSKGKIQAEELRGQLGDRMAGAFKLFAEGMGVSTSELDAMLKKGTVLAEDVLPKFANQLNKKYTLGFGQEIETKQAQIVRLTNAWTMFVENVESRNNIVGYSISKLTSAFTGLLKELTPSQFITDIKNQQAEFNRLGIVLRQNWKDTKQRAELIDQMITINPNFINGLDKEKVTLEQITDALRATNAQYIQKIILQQQYDRLNEIFEEQAERIKIIAQAYTDNAIAFNGLTKAQQDTIQAFTDGNITIDQARAQIGKLGTDTFKAQQTLSAFNNAVNGNVLTSKGWISTTKDLNKELDETTKSTNATLGILDRMIKVKGNMLGIDTQLIGSTKALGGAFDSLALKQEIATKQRNEDYRNAIIEGRNLQKAYVEFNGFIYNTKTAANNGKRVGEWDIVGDKLVKRMPQQIAEKEEKPKAASLTAAQKDFINAAQGQRDTEIAIQKEKRLNLEIGEIEYWTEYEKIIKNYSEKIRNYLKGSNAKELQIKGAMYKKAVDAAVQANKEQYDRESKNLEEQGKMQVNILERNAKKIEANDELTDYQKLTRQIEVDNEMIIQLNSNYEARIKLANERAQETIDIERKRDEEIGKIEDARLAKMKEIPEAMAKGFETQFLLEQSEQTITLEKQKQLILSNKKLSIAERDYQLSQLSHDEAIENNNLEIKRLEIEKARIISLKLIRALQGGSPLATASEEAQIKELEAQEAALKSANKQASIDKASEERDRWKSVSDEAVKGLKGLGMDNLSETLGKNFDDLFKKIQDGALSAKDAALIAAAAIADGLTSIVNKQKDHTIAALNEQLKYTQETTEQEIGFINGRLEALNSLETLTAEQASERNRLEDEARVLKEQQFQREKLIEIQKARAEQRASAQQALINGALGATQAIASMPPPASFAMAGIALAFGIAQAASIMSKDPTPQYFVGRSGGIAEEAWTQEKGREIITDSSGNIKSLGSDNGPQKTWLDAGDKVYTASQTKNIISNFDTAPKLGSNVFNKIAMRSLSGIKAPVIVNKTEDHSNKIGEEVGRQLERHFKKYDKPSIVKKNGKILEYRGANIPVVLGTYDLITLAETWYQ